MNTGLVTTASVNKLSKSSSDTRYVVPVYVSLVSEAVNDVVI